MPKESPKASPRSSDDATRTSRGPLPSNEHERLRALESFQIIDSPRTPHFDDLAQQAAIGLGMPIALITFIDEDRQWVMASVGIKLEGTSREHAFCAHTIMGDEVMVVEDTHADERFKDNPYVLGDPCFRFYAGAPLLTREGHALGSICVLDTKPRRLSPSQRAYLKDLANQVVHLLELERAARALKEVLHDEKLAKTLTMICAYCDHTQAQDGTWHATAPQSDAHKTHGICPVCFEVHFGGDER